MMYIYTPVQFKVRLFRPGDILPFSASDITKYGFSDWPVATQPICNKDQYTMI